MLDKAMTHRKITIRRLRGNDFHWGIWLDGRKLGYITKFMGTTLCEKPYEVAINRGLGIRILFRDLQSAKDYVPSFLVKQGI